MGLVRMKEGKNTFARVRIGNIEMKHKNKDMAEREDEVGR